MPTTKLCKECGEPLNPHAIKTHRKTCSKCEYKRYAKITAPKVIDNKVFCEYCWRWLTWNSNNFYKQRNTLQTSCKECQARKRDCKRNNTVFKPIINIDMKVYLYGCRT